MVQHRMNNCSFITRCTTDSKDMPRYRFCNDRCGMVGLGPLVNVWCKFPQGKIMTEYSVAVSRDPG